MKRKEKTNKDCQNDRVPSLTLFYLHVVSYINLFALFYFILLFFCTHFSSQFVPMKCEKTLCAHVPEIHLQIVVAALTFFLGHDEEDKDKEDSDSDQEVSKVITPFFVCVSFP